MSIVIWFALYFAADRKNWKSCLDEFNIREHLEKLPCSNDINCKYSNQINTESFKELKQAFSQNEEEENEMGVEKKQIGKLVEKEASSFESLQRTTSLDSHIFESKIPRQSSFEKNEFVPPFVSKISEPERSSTFNAFRTARDELQIQNTKKFGKGGNTADKNFNYGAVKKSLGTRKGGVFGKFQPPLRPKDTRTEM